MSEELEEKVKKDKKYVVFLPSRDIEISGYDQVPKIGGTHA